VMFLGWCSWLCAGQPDQDCPVIESVLPQGFISEGDMIAGGESAEPVGHDVREVDPASAWGVCGVDHSRAFVVAPLADRSLARHAFSMTGFSSEGRDECDAWDRQAHARCMAILAHHPTTITPHHYVICRSAPSDPADPAAWPAPMTTGTGRA